MRRELKTVTQGSPEGTDEVQTQTSSSADSREPAAQDGMCGSLMGAGGRAGGGGCGVPLALLGRRTCPFMFSASGDTVL